MSFKSKWEGGEGEMCRKSNMETYITICEIDSQGECAVSGNSTRRSVSTERGGLGRKMGGRLNREGTYAYLWLIHVED